MVGLSKEQVLACMGPPATKAAEGATKVWGYASQRHDCRQRQL